MSELRASNPKLRPGMTHVIYAGEVCVLRDVNDDEIGVEARDDELVVDFIKSWHELRMLRAAGMHDQSPLVQEAVAKVERRFLALPKRITSQLPDFAPGGRVILPS